MRSKEVQTDEQQPPIRISDLHKSFGSQTVLNGIGLEVRQGETLAVMGRSGTGKSVLLRLLIGLEAPDSGSVSIRGQNIAELGVKELNEIRKKMGFLFQQAALYDSLTIEENVVFPISRHSRIPPGEQKKRAHELLASVGMPDDSKKLPSQISGGMQKRVGLARALALDPDILLFDEPTAGLDPITAAEIGNLIVDLKKKRQMTAVVVTHDIRGARTFADRVALIHEGKIVAEGSFAELQNSKDPFVSQFLRDGS
jgi:phospholipid/cholesterol/gamma-HCH transport system ATP-binding protein